MIENVHNLGHSGPYPGEDTIDGISADLTAMLIMMMDQRDPYTSNHMSRVSWFSIGIGKKLGFDDNRLFGLRLGSQLHDLGKSSIPPEILNKPGRLMAREIELVREHPRNGFDIVSHLKWPWRIPDMILQHHEKMDGNGYPLGIRGSQMLLESRIIAVADVVDAITSHRPYRSALPVDRALDEITARRETSYDPDVVDACVELIHSGEFNFGSNLAEFGQTGDRC